VVDDLLNSAITRGDIGDYLTQNYRFHTIINTWRQRPLSSRNGRSLVAYVGHPCVWCAVGFGTSNLPDKAC